MHCPKCNGRKMVWRIWDPGLGIKMHYEDVCETCYGSGIDLADAAAWGSVQPEQATYDVATRRRGDGRK